MHMRLADKRKSDDSIFAIVRSTGKITGTGKTTTGQTWLVFSRVNAYEQRHDGGGLRGTENGYRKRVQTSGSRGNVRTLIKAACFTAITAVKDAVNKRRTARSCDETTYLDRSWPTGRLIPRHIHRCLLFRRLMRATTLPSPPPPLLFEIFSFRKQRIGFAYFDEIPFSRLVYSISFIEKEFELLIDFILFYFMELDCLLFLVERSVFQECFSFDNLQTFVILLLD